MSSSNCSYVQVRGRDRSAGVGSGHGGGGACHPCARPDFAHQVRGGCRVIIEEGRHALTQGREAETVAVQPRAIDEGTCLATFFVQSTSGQQKIKGGGDRRL